MANSEQTALKNLRIIHCFRSPVGGIFRHVRDLILEQVKEGHTVGVICDNNTGGKLEEDRLTELESSLELGLHRLSMDRKIGFRDATVLWTLYKDIKTLNVDILHAHGAKGGAYARIIGTVLGRGRNGPARLYCPHGGSVHYDQKSLSGRVYFGLERILEKFTDRLIFVSEYEKNGFFTKVGTMPCPYSIARNGLTNPEFELVRPSDTASDFLFVGMMRDLKGVDLFLDALPIVANKTNSPVSATLVGDGPDLENYKNVAAGFNDNVKTTFLDPMPAREAFPLGRVLVVPSRAESMPYIVLEALAAEVPLISTNAGGIPEIYAEYSDRLVEADSLDALANAMADQKAGAGNLPSSQVMAARIRAEFSASVMANDVMRAYEDTISDE